jgi:hypothetical protein
MKFAERISKLFKGEKKPLINPSEAVEENSDYDRQMAELDAKEDLDLEYPAEILTDEQYYPLTSPLLKQRQGRLSRAKYIINNNKTKLNQKLTPHARMVNIHVQRLDVLVDQVNRTPIKELQLHLLVEIDHELEELEGELGIPELASPLHDTFENSPSPYIQERMGRIKAAKIGIEPVLNGSQKIDHGMLNLLIINNRRLDSLIEYFNDAGKDAGVHQVLEMDECLESIEKLLSHNVPVQ